MVKFRRTRIEDPDIRWIKTVMKPETWLIKMVMKLRIKKAIL